MESKNSPPKLADFISVCICTFKRPKMLANALSRLLSQVSDPAFTWEIIIVDNDAKRSAEKTVKAFQSSTSQNILYDCEPERNIALARNRAIRNSKGNIIVFMDDDEYPVKDWLIHLYNALNLYKADGILGPVLPDLPPEAPQWLRKIDLFDRRRFKTGTRLTARYTRTGNVLLVRNSLPEGEYCFDPAFGLTGGEDVDFFIRQIKRNRIYVWCDEAITYETVPKERWSIRFHLKKYFRLGTINGERLRNNGLAAVVTSLKYFVSIFLWMFVTLVLFPFGKRFWIKPSLKGTYSIASILAYFGISLLRYR